MKKKYFRDFKDNPCPFEPRRYPLLDRYQVLPRGWLGVDHSGGSVLDPGHHNRPAVQFRGHLLRVPGAKLL